MKKRKPVSVVKRSESSRKGWRTRKALAAARKAAQAAKLKDGGA